MSKCRFTFKQQNWNQIVNGIKCVRELVGKGGCVEIGRCPKNQLAPLLFDWWHFNVPVCVCCKAIYQEPLERLYTYDHLIFQIKSNIRQCVNI